jgi:hypothetical protein
VFHNYVLERQAGDSFPVSRSQKPFSSGYQPQLKHDVGSCSPEGQKPNDVLTINSKLTAAGYLTTSYQLQDLDLNDFRR